MRWFIFRHVSIWFCCNNPHSKFPPLPLLRMGSPTLLLHFARFWIPFVFWFCVLFILFIPVSEFFTALCFAHSVNYAFWDFYNCLYTFPFWLPSPPYLWYLTLYLRIITGDFLCGLLHSILYLRYGEYACIFIGA